MNLLKKIAVALVSVIGLNFLAAASTSDKSASETGRELRLSIFSTPAKEFGIAPTKKFPRTYAVLIDFPIDRHTATIVSLSDGSASLYTTSKFGVIGGGAHENVRLAAARLVSASDKFFDEASPTKVYPYPAPGKVRFYLVSFAGVRVIEAELSSIEEDKSRYSGLFWLGQDVLTHLRRASEKK